MAIWDYLATQRAKVIERQMNSIAFGTSMADILADIHGYSPLERGGLRWPVSVWDAPSSCEDIDGILSHLDREFAPVFDADLKFLEAQRQKIGKRMYNGTTFVLKEADLDTSLVSINCGVGNYFDAVSSCDSLEHELLTAFRKHKISTPKDVLGYCPRRSSFLADCNDPARFGAGRSAAIGISCLVAYQHGDDVRTLLRVRSGGVAAHPGKYHVIPAGMFGADTEWIDEEHSIKHSFYREYQEELFEEEEIRLQRPTGQASFDWFYSRPQLQFLFELLRDGRASLEVTGYSLNLTNYRPEILMMLLVDESDWESQELSSNYEYVLPQDIKDAGKATLAPVLLTESDDQVLEKVLMVEEGFVPPGIAALWMGKKALEQKQA